MTTTTTVSSEQQEKGPNYVPPSYAHDDAPPAFDDTTVMDPEEAEVINYKTLSWWYVTETSNRTLFLGGEKRP